MPDALPPCPRCGATHVVRNGLTRAGSVNLLCRGCGRRFVPHPKRPPITPGTEALVRRLLLERLSLRAIARSVGVSRAWLQRFANRLYREAPPSRPGATQKKRGDLTVEADVLWSFVGRIAEVRWVWAAVDADTRQVVALVVGDRSGDTARRLWAALPNCYRDWAVMCTDFWSAYLAAVPEERHAAGGKESGLTTRVERFWCTARQRSSRLVRRTLSFAKCDRNHLGALWYFVRHYNTSLL